jgi:hypothetical protein
MLLPFIFSKAWADKMEKPKIVIINDFAFYENAVEVIVKKVQKNGGEVKNDNNKIMLLNNQLVNDTISLGKQAQAQVKDEGEETNVLDKKKGINVWANKEAITSIEFFSYCK